MIGIAAPTACHTVAAPEILCTFANGDHSSRAAVTEGRKSVETAPHFVVGGLDAVGSRKIEHLLDQVRPSQRFTEKRLLGSLYLGALGAGTDGGKGGSHQYAARAQFWLGNFVSAYLAGSNVFQNGSHEISRQTGFNLWRRCPQLRARCSVARECLDPR